MDPGALVIIISCLEWSGTFVWYKLGMALHSPKFGSHTHKYKIGKKEIWTLALSLRFGKGKM